MRAAVDLAHLTFTKLCTHSGNIYSIHRSFFYIFDQTLCLQLYGGLLLLHTVGQILHGLPELLDTLRLPLAEAPNVVKI